MLNTAENHSHQDANPAIRAYFGGSFDPVHIGHLQISMYVYDWLLPLAKQQQRELHVSLLPNARSPFKQESTNPEHRLAMLNLAIKDTPLQINELELWQSPPVYTIDSVQTLRSRYPNDSLIFIMGMDSARSLDQWKDGLTLTDYVSLWVFNRTEQAAKNKQTLKNDAPALLRSQLPKPLQPFVVDSISKLLIANTPNSAPISALKNSNQGRIYIDSRPVSSISSTQIRQQLQQMFQDLSINHAAETQIATLQPINDIMCPTPSNPSAKWLNPAVYHYIIAHQLYSTAQFR